ncbi:MAG: ATP-binding protein, partial [Acidobacteriota bacterium]|nr:ATP-binding protein [Acidobacteriota bacterium]
PNPALLIEALEQGAAAAIITEEALPLLDLEALKNWLGSQPPWSDLPFLVLTARGRGSSATAQRAREIQALGNVTLLERPVRPETIETAVRAALRARMRQYEMRRRQETLTRVNADLEQFAYSASHDLQEPIRNIAVYSDLLIRRYGDLLDGKGQEFLHFVNGGAKRMELLVRDLLAYTRAASISDEAPEPVDADGPLDGALLNLAEAIRQSEAQIIRNSLPAVRMQETHLQQLFQNLIGNAIKYRRGERPEISISARGEDSQWTFALEDNGIGIGPQYQEQIFGIFKRLHGSGEYTGTGIGLAICQRIVERYRGRIWVESELGKGSTFFFTIPA